MRKIYKETIIKITRIFVDKKHVTVRQLMKINNKFYWCMFFFRKSLKRNYDSQKIEAKKLQKEFENATIIYINKKRRYSFTLGYFYLPFHESDLC